MPLRATVQRDVEVARSFVERLHCGPFLYAYLHVLCDLRPDLRGSQRGRSFVTLNLTGAMVLCWQGKSISGGRYAA